MHRVVCVGEACRALLLQLDGPSLAWLGNAEAPRLAAGLAECMGTVDASVDASTIALSDVAMTPCVSEVKVLRTATFVIPTTASRK